MTSDQHAHANPQQVHDNLSNEIADILLGPDSPVRGNPEFDESIAEHDRLTKRQDELKTLDTKLVEVLPGLEQVEDRLTEAAKQLAAEKKRLTGFAGELGEAAFAGLRAGELPDHPLFADRKELQSRVESLQRQKAELVAGENAGMMEKAKVQAQQLKLTGQIKVEELKIGSLDRALGTALLTSKEKPTVQCGQSEEVLKAIDNQRKQVAAAKETVEQAEQAVAGRKSAAAETLGRSTVNNADSLKSELKDTRKEHRQHEKGIESIRSSVVATGLETESLREEAIIGEKLKQLWSLNFDLEESKPQAMKFVEKSVTDFTKLPRKFKYSICGIAGVVVLLLAMSFFGADGNDREVTSNDSGKTHSPTTADSLPEEDAINAIKAVGGKVERDDSGQLKVDFGKDTVDADLKYLNGLTGLTSLSLDGSKITDAGLVHLKGLTGLKELDLGRTKITDAGLVHLKGLTRLEELNLFKTKITDAGLVHLKGLTGLTSLRLDFLEITDAGLVHLKGLTKLTDLWLNDTNITDVGLVHLKGLSALNTLTLTDTSVSPEFRDIWLDDQIRKMFAKLPQSLNDSSGQFTYRIGSKVHQGRSEREQSDGDDIEYVYATSDETGPSAAMIDWKKRIVTSGMLGLKDEKLVAGPGRDGMILTIVFKVRDPGDVAKERNKKTNPGRNLASNLMVDEMRYKSKEGISSDFTTCGVYVKCMNPGPGFQRPPYWGKPASRVPRNQQLLGFDNGSGVPILSLGEPFRITPGSGFDMVEYGDLSPAIVWSFYRNIGKWKHPRLVAGSRAYEMDESAIKVLNLVARAVGVVRYAEGYRIDSQERLGD